MFTFTLREPTEGESGYCLRVPVLPLGRNPIAEIEHGLAFDSSGISVSMTREDRYLVVTATGFADTNAAESFVPSIASGLRALALRWNIAFRATREPRPITVASDPEAFAQSVREQYGLSPAGPVYGLVEADAVTAYPAGVRILLLGVGPISASVSTGRARAQEVFRIGVEAAKPPGFREPSDAERIAFDLYNSSFYESDIRSRLLTLVMALEVLAPNGERHAEIVSLVASWREQIRHRLHEVLEPSLRFELEAFRGELGFKKESSKRIRIARMMRELATASDDLGAIDEDVKFVYDTRSLLAHNGVVSGADLDRAHEKALSMVKAVLAARMHLAPIFLHDESSSTANS